MKAIGDLFLKNEVRDPKIMRLRYVKSQEKIKDCLKFKSYHSKFLKLFTKEDRLKKKALKNQKKQK